MKYFESLIDYIIETKNISKNYISENLIHPYSFASFCDFIYCDEVIDNKKIDINTLKDNDTIFVDSKLFDNFVDKILPNISKKINIVTARELLPQIQKSEKTDLVLNNKNILVWFAQNPIYENSSKYIAIPYGIRARWGSETYINCIINNLNVTKTTRLSHLPAKIHNHLPQNHIRRNPELEYDVKKIICPRDFYNQLASSLFTISLSGDRFDSYRHYESIGLGTIPISDIPELYQTIFGESMILNKNIKEILDLIHNGCSYSYQKPNRDIITTKYWYNFFLEKIY